MTNWNKITLFKFQQIEAINAKEDMSDIDKTLFSTCIIFNLTEYQLDNMKLKHAAKLIKKVTEIFNHPFEPKPFEVIGKYMINYDPFSMRYGQYRELSYYLSENIIANAHKVLASISNEPDYVNDSATHSERAEYFLKQPITRITGSIAFILEKFKAFNKKYQWLFGLDSETHDEHVKADPFNKKYGWLYAGEQVARLEGIPLDSVDMFPTIHVFSQLAYLKEKDAYEARVIKQNQTHG